MMPKKDEKGNTVCSCSCGYTDKSGSDACLKDAKTKEEKAEVDVVDKDIETLPITKDEECPKCGNREAYYWLIQTRAGDEPETKFMRCTKCKHTWRDYS